MRNRAAVLVRPSEIVVEERPVPEPGPRDVLVEISAVGVCGSDVHYYEHGGAIDHESASSTICCASSRIRSSRSSPSSASA